MASDRICHSGAALSLVLSKLDPETAQWVDGFAGSVPEDLPDLAFPQVNFVRSDGSLLGPDGIVGESDGSRVDIELVIGNPSLRSNRAASVLCFVEYEQQPCSSSAWAWDVSTPARSFAFLPMSTTADPGERIDILFVPSNQAGYPFPIALGFSMFMEFRKEMEPEVELPSRDRIWPFEGCNFARVLQKEPPIGSFRLPKDVQRDDGPLLLLLELCIPDQVVKLVALSERSNEIPIDRDLWTKPVRINGRTALIPMEQKWFYDVEELQIAVVRNEYGAGMGPAVLFSDAVTFAP